MVLSKLRHASAANKFSEREKEGLSKGLQARMGESLTGLKPLEGGTLGVVFAGILDGSECCFKSNVAPLGVFTLQRECAFLQRTAGSRADARLITINESHEDRTWLQMKQLRSCSDLTPTTIRELAATYEAQLKREIDSHLVPLGDNIHLLLQNAEEAITFLSARCLISPNVKSEAEARISYLRSVSGEWDLQLCHGDLGPANILCDDIGPIAIDWEDAFWGIAGYDYLYWLTFFSNRRWLSPEVLGHTPWGRSSEVALMIMVLLLKCMLSVRDGSYHGNKISFDRRLMEVSDLD